MKTLSGVISNRLRKLFGQEVGEWPAARVDDAIMDMSPDKYHGIHLGGPAGRIGRHRAGGQ